MIKICSPQLGMSPYSSLGGEIYDYQTIKGFTKKGFKVFVYLPKNRPYDKLLKNMKVTYAPIMHVVPPWIYSFLCLPYIFRTYQKERFDILRIHSPRYLGIAALIFHFFYPKVPVLSNGITVDSEKYVFPIEKLTYSISRAIITQGEYMKKYLVKKYSIDKNKIHVTYGGQLNDRIIWKKIPESAKLVKPNDKILLFMGILIPRKNPTFLLDIFLKLSKKFKDIKLVFIGDGSERKKIEAFSKHNNLEDKILLVKSAYGREKSYWFSRMDIFLFPSFGEGFGLVITEAMSYSKVVVASKIKVFDEILVDGVNGYTLSLRNKNKWINLISKLLTNRELVNIVGEKAKSSMKQKYSWDRAYELNKKVIKSIL